MSRQEQLAKQTIYIISGEHESGTRELYAGKKTSRAIRARLTRERSGGDRWAEADVEGYRVRYEDIRQWFD